MNRCLSTLLRLAIAVCIAASTAFGQEPKSSSPPTPAEAPKGEPQKEAAKPSIDELLRTHSLERVICAEDLAEVTVSFTHFADELDAFEDDYYETKGKGIVLGIQDSQYVIFSTRCALDFEWPNHEVRWRNIHGPEDGAPEFLNEGIILHGTSVPGGGDEFFAYGTSNLGAVTEDGQPPAVHNARQERRNVLAQAREVGDVVRIDRFKGCKGELSDVALLYVPIHRESTIRLKHLGLTKPKDSVRELLAKQGVLFGIEFEFSCPECQKVVVGYESREIKALVLGFAVGLVSGAMLEGFVQRLSDVDSFVAKGAMPTARIDPLRRIADAGLRRQILDRDRSACAYAKYGMCNPATCWACIAKDLHMDHVLPFSKGGLTVPENLVTACAACNLSKGAELVTAWIGSGAK